MIYLKKGDIVARQNSIHPAKVVGHNDDYSSVKLEPLNRFARFLWNLRYSLAWHKCDTQVTKYVNGNRSFVFRCPQCGRTN